MDRERLDRLMNDPARVKREDIADLKAMTERYPWFSGAHLLLAVGEHAAGDLLFDEQLRTTAAHLPSRAVLFDQVHAYSAPAEPREPSLPTPDTDRLSVGPAAVPPPVKEEPVAAAPLVVVPKDPPLVAEVPVIALEVPPSAPEPPVPAGPEARLTVVPEEPIADEVPEAPVAAEEAEPAVVAPAPGPAVATDPLDLQIREAALASSYELTWDFEAELAAARSTPVTFEEAPVAPPQASAPMDAPITTSTRKRFTDWLDLAPPAEPADLPADLRLDQIAPAPDAGDWLREGETPAVPPAAPAPANDTKHLIDRFIQQAAVQPAKKAEFFTPQQAAKRSLEDHADLVSETLARVYEKQGNYAKAIAAYERLALKHPDKSAYFAALSEALRARTSR